MFVKKFFIKIKNKFRKSIYMTTQQSSLLNFAKRKEVEDEELSASPMRKKLLYKDEGRQYRGEWNLEYFTLKLDETKYLCLICNQELSSMKESNVKRHFERKHKEFSPNDRLAEYQSFSILNFTLSKYRASHTQSHLRDCLLVSISKIEVDLVELIKKMRCEKSLVVNEFD
ncbi:MAG: hypothetical protein MHMPM18_002016 [Marteilia pararefringens]